MMKRMMQAVGGVSALGLLLVLPVAAHAQAVYGSINGQVTDTTGAAIPNATITVSDVQKGTSVTATSNGSGEYAVEHLLADFYNVRCEAQGFKSFEASNVQVFVDTSPKISCQLGAGSSTETVTVSADTQPELKTDRADVSTVFDSKETYDLPLGDRNFTNLQLLLPGAQVLGWSHAASENPQGSRQIQIDGQAFGGTAFELDGTDNQDPILGIIVINPPLDAVGEAKITTQNFDAEFGKAVSAVIVSSTKSGSNTFHGSAFDFRQSTANQALDPFGPNFIAPGLKNLFGGSIGGPILKDKLFFFGDYQGVRQKSAVTSETTLPTEQLFDSCIAGACDFSQYLALGVPGTIFQHLPDGTSKRYPNNTLPAGSTAPQAVAFFKDLQAAAQSYSNFATQGYENGVLTSNFKESGTGLFNANAFDVRLDYQLNDRIHMFTRYSRFADTLSGKSLLGPEDGGEGFGINQFAGTSLGNNDSTAAGVDFALNPKLLTDIRLGYYRYFINTHKNDEGVNYASMLGIPGENTGTVQTSGSPGFVFSSIANSGDQPIYGNNLGTDHCNCPLIEHEDQYQVVNNWTKIIGNHAVKFGADLRYARNLRVPSDTNRTGLNNFYNNATLDTFDPTDFGSKDPNQGTGGISFATFALGEVSDYQRYTSVSTNAKEFQKRTFFYVQDTWRATPNLTVNYGLRYDIFFPEAVNAPGNGSLLNLNTGYLQVAGIGNVASNMNASPDLAAFSPRIGLAYQMNPKTVIRAGYGRSYDIGVFGSIFGHVVTQNLPVLANQTFSPVGETGEVFTLASGPSPATFPQPEADGLLPNPGYAVQSKARVLNLRLPRLDAWNLAIQRSLTPTLSLTMAYVGNKGTHTLADGDGNNTNPNESAIFLPAQYSVTGSTLHYDPSANGLNAATGATSNQTLLDRYYGGTLAACQDPVYEQERDAGNPNGPGPGLGANDGRCGWTNPIQFYHDSLDTHFNALQVTLAKQFSKGLQFTSNYQWASAFSYNSNYVTWDKTPAYGRDSNVREQAETLYGTWDLPIGKGGQYFSGVNGLVDEIIGHWELSGTMNWAGGLPYNLTYNECGTVLPGSACGADSSPDSNGARAQTSLGGFDASTKTRSFFHGLGGNLADAPEGGFSRPALDTFGNVGRNNYFGPAFFNSDMAIQKGFPLHEALQAQFRMDAFNVFNHINPGNPNNTNIDSSPLAGQGVITGQAPGGNSRYIQLSARIQF